MFVLYGFIHYLVCSSGALDTVMIFTTTISVSNIYSTSSFVIVPIIWLYITVVVAVIYINKVRHNFILTNNGDVTTH